MDRDGKGQTMEGFLALGFLVGMSHALEADHLAAIGAMAAGKTNGRRRLVIRGAAWGIGHSITLLAICALVLLFGFALTAPRAAAMEFSVGVMLVLLGLSVFWRLWRRRVHFHRHSHGGRPHIHVHSHAGATLPHATDPHHHRHPEGPPVTALLVGLVHGAAGSAGLLTLAVATSRNPATALGYVALFGLGSIAGMALLSFAASWPLGLADRGILWLHRGIAAAAGAGAIVIGADVMFATGALAWTNF